ncbi:uncharacterized protein LOC132738553 [Ruditapes philippinarum]|uniref:uncharacterized protein LOC132738553 n=1 Tax=Ruditapes philippinarum TaxID=129788 RepID=UPI00295C1A1F|nr:uncharacterized protein LOC132738553 [Ruditapes philippinarum]
MEEKTLVAIILLSSISGILAGEWCTEYTDDWFDSKETMYCENGCCGSTYDQYCCISGKDEQDEQHAGRIVGIVLGSIALVAAIVSILVAVFCCCRKSRGQAGQVCQLATGAQTTVQMQGMAGYGQVGYNSGIQYPIMTSNVAPGTVQQWQQPPPYDQLQHKQ